MKANFLLVVGGLLVAIWSARVLPADSLPPQAAHADYQRLQAVRFTSQPTPIPEGGIRWSLDTATWELVSGTLWLQEPTSEGAVTGLVFEGTGRFRMTVPDPFERAQLRRFTRRPNLEALEETFTQMVLRASGEEPLASLGTPPEGAAYAEHRLARERLPRHPPQVFTPGYS